MLVYPILVFLAITSRTSAKPLHDSRDVEVAGLSIHANINLNRLSNILDADLARAAHLRGHGRGEKHYRKHPGKRQSAAISATNTAVIH
jgi:uncharacterized protein YcbX